jgi:hypothetical protein
MQLLKVVLALAAVAFVPSDGVAVKAVAGQSLRQDAARKRTAAPTTAAPTTAAPTTPTAAAPTTLNPTAAPTTPTAAAPPGCTCGCLTYGGDGGDSKCCCNTDAEYPGECSVQRIGGETLNICISDYEMPDN